jgi:2-isopropylmalate synthase
MVKRAVDYCPNVEFSPEDAARTELDFLCEVVEKTIEAGATTVNIPDTVGYATPDHFRGVIAHLKQHVSNIERAVISTHCHNDLGLAVANSLAAVEAGARQVECTINGLGERAGNAALEEVVMALHTRRDVYGVTTNINTQKLYPTSRLVERITGMTVQRNKAIVGQNAFAHEAGIHQHGILQERSTYEIMKAEDVGYVGTNLVLGKHSGRHAFRDRVNSLGYRLEDEVFQQVFEDFIALADRKKEIVDSDIVALIENRSDVSADAWKLISFHTSAGTSAIPTATLEMQYEDEEETRCDAATGDGPIDAVFWALERITGIAAKLKDYQVRNISSGKDAQGEVLVEIEVDGGNFHGKGVSTDIIEASALAYLKALNRSIAATRVTA